MRRLLVFLLALLISPQTYGEDSQNDLLAGFVVGRYRLVGQRADADATCHGHVEISRAGQAAKLRVKRAIAGLVIEGSAAIENALHDEVPVLRMRFRENHTAYETTCLVQGDLNHYARLSCHLYRQDGGTQRPGLEALFLDVDQR